VSYAKLWDIDSVFPSIDRSLDRMNDVQPVFGFELVALSVPIRAWYLEERAEDGTPYLWAERLARRLRRLRQPAEENLPVRPTRKERSHASWSLCRRIQPKLPKLQLRWLLSFLRSESRRGLGRAFPASQDVQVWRSDPVPR
jgi:hypothetical protein